MADYANLRRIPEAAVAAPVNVVVNVEQPASTKADENGNLPPGRVTLVLSYEEFAALGRRCVETRQSKQQFVKALVVQALGL